MATPVAISLGVLGGAVQARDWLFVAAMVGVVAFTVQLPFTCFYFHQRWLERKVAREVIRHNSVYFE